MSPVLRPLCARSKQHLHRDRSRLEHKTRVAKLLESNPLVVLNRWPGINPLLPFHIEASRFWTTKSWDRTQVPKPFSTIAIAIGEPIDVADTSEATIETDRAALESSLADLERRALSAIRHKPSTLSQS